MNSRPARNDSTRISWSGNWETSFLTAVLNSVVLLTLLNESIPLDDPSVTSLTNKGKVKDSESSKESLLMRLVVEMMENGAVGMCR